MAILQLCLGVLTVIQLTSSQSTYDVVQQENDFSSCGRADQVLSELSTGASEMQKAMSQLVTSVSQIQTAISQLQSDVAEVKAVVQQQAVTGIPESRLNIQSKPMCMTAPL